MCALVRCDTALMPGILELMVSAWYAGLLFVLGAIGASFVGVVAGRYATGESILVGRSRCDACGRELPWWALVPVFSYIAGRGRAQCCGARITILAPLSELLLGTLFALGYMKLGLTFALAFTLVALAALLALVLYDLAHQILPPPFLVVFVSAAAAARVVEAASRHALGVSFIVSGSIALSLFLLYVFSRGRAVGFADSPLALGLSLLVGSSALPGFLFSFWVGAGIGIIILARRPAGSRMGIEVPFAPFLATGFLLAYFFISWNPFLVFLA